MHLGYIFVAKCLSRKMNPKALSAGKEMRSSWQVAPHSLITNHTKSHDIADMTALNVWLTTIERSRHAGGEDLVPVRAWENRPCRRPLHPRVATRQDSLSKVKALSRGGWPRTLTHPTAPHHDPQHPSQQAQTQDFRDCLHDRVYLPLGFE